MKRSFTVAGLLPALLSASVLNTRADVQIAILTQIDNINTMNDATIAALAESPVFNMAIQPLQEELGHSCGSITKVLAGDSGTLSSDGCSKIQVAWGNAASWGEYMFSQLDTKVGTLSSADAETLAQVFKTQEIACDNAAEAIEKGCPAQADDIKNAQAAVDEDSKTTESDLDGVASRRV